MVRVHQEKDRSSPNKTEFPDLEFSLDGHMSLTHTGSQ
jgi:hypothetical protein